MQETGEYQTEMSGTLSCLVVQLFLASAHNGKNGNKHYLTSETGLIAGSAYWYVFTGPSVLCNTFNILAKRILKSLDSQGECGLNWLLQVVVFSLL